jgi:hypothetical protein
MSVEETHEEKETLVVDVLLPGHEARTETSLFRHTKTQLLQREEHRCWICGRNPEETGKPAQVHHRPVERSLAMGIDFKLVQRDCEAGMYGPDAQAFDWPAFWSHGDVYAFVDNALANGRVLCGFHHISKGTGIHMLPEPLWLAQRYMKKGYQYTPGEVICHANESDVK